MARGGGGVGGGGGARGGGTGLSPGGRAGGGLAAQRAGMIRTIGQMRGEIMQPQRIACSPGGSPQQAARSPVPASKGGYPLVQAPQTAMAKATEQPNLSKGGYPLAAPVANQKMMAALAAQDQQRQAASRKATQAMSKGGYPHARPGAANQKAPGQMQQQQATIRGGYSLRMQEAIKNAIQQRMAATMTKGGYSLAMLAATQAALQNSLQRMLSKGGFPLQMARQMQSAMQNLHQPGQMERAQQLLKSAGQAQGRQPGQKAENGQQPGQKQQVQNTWKQLMKEMTKVQPNRAMKIKPVDMAIEFPPEEIDLDKLLKKLLKALQELEEMLRQQARALRALNRHLSQAAPHQGIRNQIAGLHASTPRSSTGSPGRTGGAAMALRQPAPAMARAQGMAGLAAAGGIGGGAGGGR